MNKEYEVPQSEEIQVRIEEIILQNPSMQVPDIPGQEDDS